MSYRIIVEDKDEDVFVFRTESDQLFEVFVQIAAGEELKVITAEEDELEDVDLRPPEPEPEEASDEPEPEEASDEPEPEEASDEPEEASDEPEEAGPEGEFALAKIYRTPPTAVVVTGRGRCSAGDCNRAVLPNGVLWSEHVESSQIQKAKTVCARVRRREGSYGTFLRVAEAPHQDKVLTFDRYNEDPENLDWEERESGWIYHARDLELVEVLETEDK